MLKADLFYSPFNDVDVLVFFQNTLLCNAFMFQWFRSGDMIRVQLLIDDANNMTYQTYRLTASNSISTHYQDVRLINGQ